MAKSRAQRKAERRKREAQQARQAQAERRDESRAQHDTQVPESADVVEAELAEKGADLEALREQGDGAPAESPAPSRADVGRPADPEAEAPPKESRRERKRREREEARQKEERRLAREKKAKAAAAPEKERNVVAAFIASCWAELKRVQWPNRDTLIQASAVTIIFVAVMAAYLGVLDAIFSRLVDLFIS